MRILLLGGTAFLGRAIATAALGRGHDVTCLARGTGDPVPGATFVCADRDDDAALVPVASQTWDAVIDLTSHPVHTRRLVHDVTSAHWVYVSSSSVYVRGDVAEQDESAPTAEPLEDDYLTDPADYGRAKVACEAVYRRHSACHTIIRSGLIGGYGDHTGRSGYYPWRFAHPTSSDVLIPDPTTPIAMIDVEDLAAWVIHCVEEGHFGTFNAVGSTISLDEVLTVSRQITGSTAEPRVVSDEDLAANGISAWRGPKSLPLWINDPAYRYVATLDTAAARARGLTLRSLRDLLQAAWQYEEDRGGPQGAGLTDEQERHLRLADPRAANPYTGP